MGIDSNDENLHQKPHKNTFLDPKTLKLTYSKVQFQKLPGEGPRTPHLKGRWMAWGYWEEEGRGDFGSKGGVG